MASFNYRAIDNASRMFQGKVEASDEYDLAERLRGEGLSLIEASKEKFILPSRLRMNEKTLLSFTYFLHLIFSSGVSVMQGLSDIARQTAHRKMAETAALIHADLSTGKSISESMALHPRIFPAFYVSMVRAGEVSGKLEGVLSDIMAYLEWQIQLKKDMKSLLAYPVIVITAVCLLITLLFVFIMPKFITIIESLQVAIPLPTVILMAIVNFFKTYWPFILLVVFTVPVLMKMLYRTTGGRLFFDGLVIKLPLINTFVKKINHSRYFRTFATLFRSGLSMNDTLRISTDVIKNSVIAKSFNRVSNAVLGGEALNQALRDTGDFDPLLVNMIEVGEKTGTLDNTVLRISEIYDKEVPETLKKIFTILEPVIIILLGGVVLLTLASFFLPFYRMIGGIR